MIPMADRFLTNEVSKDTKLDKLAKLIEKSKGDGKVGATQAEENAVARVLKRFDNNKKYKWNEAAQGDNPNYTKTDRKKLNRKEGYEMAPFIASVLNVINWQFSSKNIITLETYIHSTSEVMKEKLLEMISNKFKK